MKRKSPPIAVVDQIISPELLQSIIHAKAVLPLDVMTNTMRMLYSGAQQALAQYTTAVGPEREYLMDVARKHSVDACSLAKEIAPYMHRKMPLAVESRDLTEEDKDKMAETVKEVEKVLSDHQHAKRAKVDAPSPKHQTH